MYDNIKMDTNKFYCRNGPQQTLPTASISPSSSIKTSCSGNVTQEIIRCSSNHSSAAFNCKDMLSRNATNKSQYNSRNNVGPSLGTVGCNSNSYCSNNTGNSGNYINIMPIPIGTLQYQRKKVIPQEYQSRLYYNTTDTKYRNEFYANCGSMRLSAETPTSTEEQQDSCQHQLPKSLMQQQNYLLQQQQHLPQHSLQQLNQQHSLQIHHHQSLSSSNTVADANNDNRSCMVFSNSGHTNRVMAATQTNNINNNGTSPCDQILTTSSVSLASVNVPAPMMYTVHRVVTTAQVQTTRVGSFTSAASVSSVSVADCLSAGSDSTAVTVSANEAYLLPNNGSASTVNAVSESDHNVIGNDSIAVVGLRSPPGMSTNSGFLPLQQKKCDNTLESQQNSTTCNRYSATTITNSHFTTAGKTQTLVTRSLQNVIPTCVYLMSRIAVHMEIEGTAQCPTQVMLAAALGCEELGIANKLLAQSVFGLWMSSALLEVQLKSHHCPYIVRVAWPNLLEKFSQGNTIEKKFDEPMIMLKRSVFFSKRDEEKIKDHRILELLYEEAKQNVLLGRYIMEPVHSLMLGGIQARIELGPYNSHSHSTSFFRENQARFLPPHVAKSSSWAWLPVSRKNSAEVKLLEQFKRVPQTATTRKLMRKYLEFCWALPFYGAAFFHGQVEQPMRGLMSWVNHKDVKVLIAVNERGVFILDPFEFTLLLGLRYEDLSWDYAKPSSNDDPDCQTCIFLQFDAIENGIQISKLMQIFSKQAAMIDALIYHFTELIKKRKSDGNAAEHDEPNPIQNNGNGVLCNKLSRLTLATFDEEGRCIGQMGSLSISY